MTGKLLAVLGRFQGAARLFVAPFAEIQEAIRDHCHEAFRVVLYRRFMMRIASALARREGCLGLVTGENLGQVASQTLENMHAVNSVAGPVRLSPAHRARQARQHRPGRSSGHLRHQHRGGSGLLRRFPALPPRHPLARERSRTQRVQARRRRPGGALPRGHRGRGGGSGGVGRFS